LTPRKIFWILTTLLVLLAAYGLSGLIMNDVTQSDTASKHAWWLLIPSIPLAIYYSYKLTFAHDKKSAFWRNLVSVIAFSVFISLALVKSGQGYLYIYNCSMGNQKPILLKGFVNYREKPRRLARLFSQYTLTVTLDSSKQRIKLAIKTDKYEAGQRIELQMKMGSLGYLYR